MNILQEQLEKVTHITWCQQTAFAKYVVEYMNNHNFLSALFNIYSINTLIVSNFLPLLKLELPEEALTFIYLCIYYNYPQERMRDVIINNNSNLLKSLLLEEYISKVENNKNLIFLTKRGCRHISENVCELKNIEETILKRAVPTVRSLKGRIPKESILYNFVYDTYIKPILFLEDFF